MHAFIFIFIWFNKNISIPKVDFNFFILLNEYVSSCECMLYAYVYVCTCVDTFEHRSQICVYYMFMYMSLHVYICTWRPCGHVCMHGCVCICLCTCLHMCIFLHGGPVDMFACMDMCVYMFMYMSAHVYINLYMETWSRRWVSSSVNFHLIFQNRVSHWNQSSPNVQSTWPVNLRDMSVSASLPYPLEL